MKINVLDKKVYNRIAAGEVVERPYSVIKELVENSIDAGAKNITVSVWNGGKDRVEVEDDGCGIEKGEMFKAFLPHATSKISEIADLDDIVTLGFRGEALASIASVAKVTVISKPKEQEFGAKIYAEGGNIGETQDAASKDGTKITVDDLFFNTPVRAKFLKTSRAEEGDITNIVSRLILANPNISFRYFADDKLILQSYGGGAEEALIAVYGANTVRECFRIETEKNGVGISGYVGRHNFSKPNRTYQTLIINGRYVINATVSSAVQNAYQAYLMKRQYPFYVLELKIPTEAVDVNVHPNKTDVRFSNNQVIYGAVYSVVSKVLDGTNDALDIIKTDYATEGKEVVFPEVENDENNDNKKIFTPLEFPEDDGKIYIGREYSGVKQKPIMQFSTLMDSGVERDEAAEKRVEEIFNENKKYLEESDRRKSERERTEAESVKASFVSEHGRKRGGEEKPFDISGKEAAETSDQADMGVDYDFIYVGQAFKTYLIFEKNGDLFFIDQHAAHERLLYDALYEKALKKSVASQPLLVPYILNLNSVEDDYFRTRREYIEELGFAVEDFGRNAYKITEVPLELAEISLDAFFNDALTDNSLKQEKIPEVIREKLCQRACKAAIKAGYDLSEGEIRSLIRRMNGDMGLKCPHGRPVAVRITETEIEKWFKRIV